MYAYSTSAVYCNSVVIMGKGNGQIIESHAEWPVFFMEYDFYFNKWLTDKLW